MKKQTQAIHVPYRSGDPYGALSMPVYHCAAYEFANAQEMSDAFCGRTEMPDYSRVTNPTVIHFEDRIRELTGAYEVVAFSSGMAAISTALLAVSAAGKNIVSSRHMFGNTYSLITETLPRFGVEARCTDLTNLQEVEAVIDANTCCIFLEIITNPQLEVADLRALSEVAHRRGIPLIADTTVIPFVEFSSHELGVDIEVVSSTKYLSGGATSIGGVMIDYGTVPGLKDRIRLELLRNLGSYMSPHVAYMQTVGLETLHARYAVQSANALRLATMLRTVPQIRRVNYVGLPDHPYHELARRQFGPTAGAVLTIDLADEAACYRFINSLRLVKRATNLFDSRTLAIHPASTIFGPFTPEQRRAMDVLDTTIRISVGLEDMEDVFEDIKQSVEGC